MVEKISYCDKCRDKMRTNTEIYIIIFDEPSSGLGSILGGNKTKFSLCKPCYWPLKDNIEEKVMGKR